MAGLKNKLTNLTAAATGHGQSAADSEHEAALTGVMALANLFGNCVEAFGLVHPSFRWDKQEQLLITALGVQQARLLIWGDVVGVCSPPPSVTDRAVPRHPSAAYPDLKEPTFFQARDPRLDESETRQQIDNALSAIADRANTTTREEMMEKYGLRPPKRFGVDHPPPLDYNRLEHFRERYELLKEVAESYAHISTHRSSSIVASSWMISDHAKFATFLQITQDKVDFVIDLLGVKEHIDRAMRMDIRALGWHLSADRARVALDTSKLRLISECCNPQYPEYIEACKQALDNIERERRENAPDYQPYTGVGVAPLNTAHPAPRSGRGSVSAASGASLNGGAAATAGGANGLLATEASHHGKKPGFLGNLFKRKSASHVPKVRSLSVADAGGPGSSSLDPPRALSDVGPLTSSHEAMTPDVHAAYADHQQSQALPGAIRSKSVGDILDAPINTAEEEEARNRLVQMMTNATVEDDEAPSKSPAVAAAADDAGGAATGGGGGFRLPADTHLNLMPKVSVHDQYRGLARQETKIQE